MKQRVITAIALLSVLAVVVWQINTPVLAVVVAFLAAVAAVEIMNCAKITNKAIKICGAAFAAATPFFASASALTPVVKEYQWGKVINAVPGVVFIIAICLIFLLSMLKGYSHTSFENVAVGVFASVIVPFDFSLFIRFRDMFNDEQYGIYLIFYALICALATDTGAQLGGMAFGKTKMSPNISPKKTIEGAACGIITSIVLNGVAMCLFNKFAAVPLSSTEMTVLMVAAPFVSFMGMMGDLSASVLKRNFGVKDFGKIFPGHGGVMDRMDSTLFTLPCTYAIILVLNQIVYA